MNPGNKKGRKDLNDDDLLSLMEEHEIDPTSVGMEVNKTAQARQGRM